MENEKNIKGIIGEAALNLDQFNPENPELTQAFMLKGIGYALLAIFEVLNEWKSK